MNPREKTTGLFGIIRECPYPLFALDTRFSITINGVSSTQYGQIGDAVSWLDTSMWFHTFEHLCGDLQGDLADLSENW